MLPVSVIIVNYNTAEYLRECLTSIYQWMDAATEVIVVDNASTDTSVDMVKTQFPQVKLIQSEKNLGFGLGNNLGVQHATQPYVFLFNSDAFLQMDTARALLEYMQKNPDVKCVTPQVVLPKTFEIQPKTFGYAPSLKRIVMQSVGLNRIFKKHSFFNGTDGEFRHAREMQVGWVSGVCMLMRREDFLKVCGFDARFFMYCEDVQLCLKLSKLGKIMLLDDFPIVHYGGASSKSIASKVRNSVWQQRHLLMILRDDQGIFSTVAARLVMLVGMLARLIVSALKIPQKGWANNESLQSAWARLKDLIGLPALKESVS